MPVKTARGIAVFLCLAQWVVALAVALLTAVPQLLVVALVLLGFAPYLLFLHVVEPWLARRESPGSSDAGAA